MDSMAEGHTKRKESPLPMQYLGSKARIAPWIISTIKKETSKRILLDLFAGTGSVALEASRNNFVCHLNDIQPYSYHLLKSIFQEKRDGIKSLIKILESKDWLEKNLFNNGRSDFEYIRDCEQVFIEQNKNGNIDWKEYKRFCEQTENKWSEKEIKKLRKSNQWNLFSSCYANTYFGVQQCLEIDTVREFAEELNANLKQHLIASTISALSLCVSSTTHLAQYLRPNSKKTAADLIKKREKSILKVVIKNLKSLVDYKISNGSIVTNLDYINAVNNLAKHNENFIVYADPPYFKEHYSRYYHVLDTLVLYDYPDLSLNPHTNKLSAGLYRKQRIVSDFGLKGKVKNAFNTLFVTCKKYELPIFLSYANTSLLSKKDIIESAKISGYKVNVVSKELQHSGQGKKHHKFVSEYLFICHPNETY